jgi:hypothetical protein
MLSSKIESEMRSENASKNAKSSVYIRRRSQRQTKIYCSLSTLGVFFIISETVKLFFTSLLRVRTLISEEMC